MLLQMTEAVEKGMPTISDSPYLEAKVNFMKLQYVNAMYPDMENDFPIISAPIMACYGTKDDSISYDQCMLWKAWTRSKCEVRSLNAGHMDTVDHHSLYIQ